jgi:glycogen debranching enzyme
MRLAGRGLSRLSTDVKDHNSATFHLTNPVIGHLAPNTVAVFRERRMSDGMTERVRVVSYASKPLRLRLSLHIAADFVDIFEVLGRRPMARQVYVAPVDGGIQLAYERGGHVRSTLVTTDRPNTWTPGRLVFDLVLGRDEPWDLALSVQTSETTPASRPAARRGSVPRRAAPPRREIDPARIEAWAARVPRLDCDDPRLVTTWRAAIRDLRALLLAEPGGSFIPAAGVPWFMAVFGRDASIAALQTMIAGGDIAYGTLTELAEYQGRADDSFREEERGKIPHEVRRGELATLGRVPHARYYGSIDATPLFVRLFADACRWSGWLGARADGRLPVHGEMPPRLQRLLPAAERALAWIDRRSSNEDGLIWYRRRHRSGIRNQVWKDSGDSYRFADGRMAQTPIAAVEVQGYAVAAWRGMAEVFEALGRTDDADRRRARADAMASRIDEAFWMPEEGTYAMGLDRYRRQIDSVGSNPGHLLWSGAVTPERAAAVAERLTAPDMFSGWGIRTLSTEMKAYNPMSYHLGSVWPHDTEIAAAGLARYGESSRAWRIADALLDAAAHDRDARLPELFAGFDRVDTPDLVGYPVACSPQAWATGAIFHIVENLVGLLPDGDQLRFTPMTQAPRIVLHDLRVGGWRGDLDTRVRSREAARTIEFGARDRPDG